MKKSQDKNELSAASFIKRLKTLKSEENRVQMQRYFKTGKGEYAEGDKFLGLKMGQLFSVVKDYEGMPVKELEKLLESPYHEVRAGAISIMDKESRKKKIADERLKAFFKLYLSRHDRINNWDLVDLACMYMTGRYLFDKSRKVLYKLARSKNFWERRTAIVSTCYFIRQQDLDDTFAISALLLKDKEDLVHKGAGWMLRFAGDKDRKKLYLFLDKYAAVMPRTMLRYAIEKLDAKKRAHYMKQKSLLK
jgi:3-methyladenine DNA glycosylase AlkD